MADALTVGSRALEIARGDITHERERQPFQVPETAAAYIRALRMAGLPD